MTKHGASAAATLLIIASLLVAAVTLADARVTVQVQRDMRVGDNYAAKDAKPVPALVCNEVHAVEAGETCQDIEGGAGLADVQFLSFNPNINCAGMFVGQWVCLDATAA